MLAAVNEGDEGARTRLIEAVHGELRRLARGYLRRERRGHSLPPTALVHDAYLKLVDQDRMQWRNRAQFFSIAAHQMRRILLDYARAHRAQKRGGGVRIALGNNDAAVAPDSVDVLALHVALEKLSEQYPRQGQLVELRFFGGLSVAETAAVLGIAPITVKRDWALARAWLYRAMQGTGA